MHVGEIFKLTTEIGFYLLCPLICKAGVMKLKLLMALKQLILRPRKKSLFGLPIMSWVGMEQER